MRKIYIIESKVMSKAHLSHVIHQLHTHTDADTLTETGEQREEFIFMR